MTRDEFSQAMFDHYRHHNRLCDRVTEHNCKRNWWHDQLNKNSTGWRLSLSGIRQLLCNPVYVTGTKYSITEQQITLTPRVTLQMSHLPFPWFPVYIYDVQRRQNLDSIWLFDDHARSWMTLCNNDFQQFLSSWTG